jgi:hypothetical protein
MGMVCGTVGAGAVAAIYLIYGAHCDFLLAQLRRENVLRGRVAYMLWRVAAQIGGPRMGTD